MPSGSHVDAARLGPGLCARACKSRCDVSTHPCCARRRRSTTLRGLSDAPLKRAASALDRFEKRPTLRPGARPQVSSRAPFLSHGQPVRRRRVGRAREDQPTSAAMPHRSSVQRVLSPAPPRQKRQRNPAWRQSHLFQDRSAEQRDMPQLLLSKVQRKAQSGEQNRKTMLWLPCQGVPAERAYHYEVHTRGRKLAGRSADGAKKCEEQHPKRDPI